MKRRIEALKLREQGRPFEAERAGIVVDTRNSRAKRKQRAKAKVVLSRVVPIEEEPITKPNSPEPVRPRKNHFKHGSWRALHKFNEVKFTGPSGSLFTNEKVS